MPANEIVASPSLPALGAFPGLFPGRSNVLHNGDVVLDVGAHCGVVAALVLRTAGTSVICVEPHPRTFGILQQNMSEHGERVQLVNKAVSDSEEPREFFSHRGTNLPSRLFFASLFPSRPHAAGSIAVTEAPGAERRVLDFFYFAEPDSFCWMSFC